MKKSHPIRRAMLATAATVSGIVLVLSLKPASDPSSDASAQGGASPQGGAEQSAVQDGAVTGAASKTEYGPVQVRVTMSGGKITKAEAVQKPQGGRSDQISADSIPKLNQAAVTAGSADIDAVSGATYTSAGYKKSLQSALDKAAQSGGGGGSSSGSAQAKTVTGDAVDTQYGPVQVRVTMAGDKITKAEAVQMPKGGRSDQISANSAPKLNQAAVTAGSADIDAVSGASYTSAGYKKSLQSALDKAPQSGGGGSAAGSGQAGSGSGSSGSGSGGSADSGNDGGGGGGGSADVAPDARVLTGAVAETQYGPVQVRITYNGGKITKAEAVQKPKGGRSDQVSANSIPKLNQAAVTAGSADIDAVSGASYTSAGYKKSLQNALDQVGG
ncbi:FMN-binding protein [Streptomyces ureilyticus]|uniref:FMN-binding protein n=1 Tax=Streptomyces ureilyticus TaxID=1775131 RepID=A0ABX0DMN9_9ACTN|nr:FMN-binding protein [Streptomyces ureilyticus]NGO41709.1 FMN-binding protein [Streptomyces ureilyticus]